MPSGGGVCAETACIKRIPDIADRDPLSIWECCPAGTRAVNIRSAWTLGGESRTGEHIPWLVKLVHCQHFGCQPARPCCELTLDPWQHDSGDEADKADWDQRQTDRGAADSCRAEAHGEQAGYDENKGTIALQDHVLPTRVVPWPAGFGHIQEASRAVSHALPLAVLLEQDNEREALGVPRGSAGWRTRSEGLELTAF
jgi:hypothetical protein